jgi:hypothetical protein
MYKERIVLQNKLSFKFNHSSKNNKFFNLSNERSANLSDDLKENLMMSEGINIFIW